MLKKLTLLLGVAMTLAACSKDSDNDPRPTPPAGYAYAMENNAIGNNKLNMDMLFFGESTVETIKDKTIFTDPTARFEFRPEGDNIYLYMHATRFAAGMPAVEMRLIASTTFTDNIMTMTSARVVPQSYVPQTKEWVDQPRYTITELHATATGTLCGVRFTCAGAFDVSYLGHLIIKKS